MVRVANTKRNIAITLNISISSVLLVESIFNKKIIILAELTYIICVRLTAYNFFIFYVFRYTQTNVYFTDLIQNKN